ncbi:MAG: FG-GAP repeat protein [Planctomycetales bacterium]|nr:FG-GAP repeat protein [Planctomycetales bacterium]
MKYHPRFTPAVLLLAGLIGSALLITFVPVEAQSPLDLIYELPMVNLHSSAANAVGGYDNIPLTIDVNGDGLPDLVMSARHPWNNTWEQFVYLNNGNGWDKVYECNRADATSPWTGDCDWRN